MIYSKICKVVIIEGDDLLFSISAVKSVISKLQSGYNYVMSSGLPIGMNIYGMTKKLLKKILNILKGKIKLKRAGWVY